MKKIFSAITLSFIALFSYAQCTVCSIDASCVINPTYPGSCPDNLPNDTVNRPYEATLTYYLPEEFDSGTIAGNVDFEKVEILGVTGLPAGLTWAAYDHTGAQNTIFFPNSNPPLTERICAKICGTPVFPGTYDVVVSARITVDAGAAGTQVVDESFIYPINIFPDANGNSAFSSTSVSGCGEVNTTFTSNVPSNGSNLYTYNWDLGNGVTSTNETVPTQTYDVAGNYTVSHTITELKYQLTGVTISTIDQDIWCGEVIEDQFCGGILQATPEYYFTFFSGLSEQSTTISDRNPVWSNLEYDINNNEFTIVYWEEDIDLINPDDSLGQNTITINGPGTYNFTLISYQDPTKTLFNATFTVELVTSQTITDTEIISVYDFPTVNDITQSTSIVCDNDTAELVVSNQYINYSWFYNGTLIADQIDNYEIEATLEGDYYVDIIDANGCVGSSNVFTFQYTTAPALPQPTIDLNGGLSLNLPLNPPTSYQWYKDGVLLPGETSNQLQITELGSYSVSATNAEGCTTFSSEIEISFIPEPTGINNFSTEFTFNVFPNPNTSGELNIDFQTEKYGEYTLKIVDMLGKEVFSSPIINEESSSIEQINITSLKAGVYMIGVQDKKSIIQMKRLMIE